MKLPHRTLIQWLVLGFLPLVFCDVFTAMVDIENMLKNEAEATTLILDRYIQSEMQRLAEIREYAERYKLDATVKRNISDVTDPVRAYVFIKNLSEEWKKLKSLLHSNDADAFIKNIDKERLSKAIKYPDDEDVDGAALGLLRLQDTYDLSTTDLANGYVGEDWTGKALNAEDCFEIGRAAYNARDYYRCIEWMSEAEARLKIEGDRSRIQRADVLEYLAYSLYQQGNTKRALVLTKELARIDPYHPRAAGNIDWYTERMTAEELATINDLPPVTNVRSLKYDIEERDVFEHLCRGEFKPDPAMEARTYCYYKRDRPFLKLAPFKVEIVRYEPLVVLFKEVISDPEIAVIQELATPRLRRATVQNAKTGELETASYRISKSAWLKGQEHVVVDRVNKRVDLMTNLNQETSEELQIANYGIGGHYDPHFDFARNRGMNPYREPTGNRIATVLFYKEEKNAFKKLGTGNRIATVLFYMSQPTRGGATVYTELGTGVFPTKHDALFWYNLKRSGEGDMRTRHAACPVLTGVKWVSNKWIHERGQEFRRPCALDPEVEEKFVGDLSPL
ncbi:Prolyl 4-hydroxylase alpha-related protein PH4 [Aphelenchoides besseyi]|nr:Prolyl 4-hydroxylase alpha-related protein PH4 [Aphelenchoides besseyi]KAI6202542.1 Prolyl 4-hydroxylase alpha-related protein PH4 [Aphelenchoides besseyi]